MPASFISRLAQPHPVPGGGGAAAHSACIALGLVEKIIRLELRRAENLPETALDWTYLLDRTKALAEKVTWLRDEDGKAYTCLAEAKASGDKAWGHALLYATDCPIWIIEAAGDALGPVLETGKRCSRRLLSDLLAACEILNGAGNAVYHIASANIKRMPDESGRKEYSGKLEDRISVLHRKFIETTRFLNSRSQPDA
jgi:formiminotetrahydrofolate cyclodeaminase